MKLLAIIIAAIISVWGMFSGGNHDIREDRRFRELAADVHGENRFKLLNILHRDYGVDRNDILEMIKELKEK